MTFVSRGKPNTIENPILAEAIDRNFDQAFAELNALGAIVGASSSSASVVTVAGVPNLRGTITRPVNNDYAWVNQGAATIRDDGDSVVLATTSAGAATNCIGRVKAVPSTPYTITAVFVPTFIAKRYYAYGLLWRDSASGKLIQAGVVGTDDPAVAGGTQLRAGTFKLTNPTTFSATYTDVGPVAEPLIWLRIADDGTNRTFSISGDGVDFVQIHSVARTDFLTADQVGFFLQPSSAAVPNLNAAVRILSWDQTSTNTASGTINTSLAGMPTTTEFVCTLTGNIDDLDFNNANTIRMGNAALATIRGLKAGSPGQEVTIYHTNAQVDLSHQDVGDTVPANRIINKVTVGKTSMTTGGASTLKYDATSVRWRLIEHEQGDWIDVAYAGGNFTANGAMTWGVDAGDQATYAFWLKGRSLFVKWYLNTTTVGGVVNAFLQIAVPGGYTIARQSLQALKYNDNGGGVLTGFCQVNAAGTIILCAKDAGNWTAAVNNTGCWGTIVGSVQ